MTDEEKQSKRDWYEHSETQAFLATLQTDRTRLVDSLVASLAAGWVRGDMTFVGGQINAIDSVLQAARWGTK